MVKAIMCRVDASYASIGKMTIRGPDGKETGHKFPASFAGADLSDANFSNADMRGAIMDGAITTGTRMGLT